MRTLPFSFLAACVLLSPQAQAQDADKPWYFQLGAGLTVQEDSDAPVEDIEFDDGYSLKAGVGRQMGELAHNLNWALELEAFFSDTEVDSDGLLTAGSSSGEDTSTFAVMFNGILDWRWSERSSLYAGAGIGYANVDFDSFDNGLDSYEPDNRDAFAWQFKGGLRYDISSTGELSWDVGYRYLQTEDIELEDGTLDDSFDLENHIHSFEVGMRWTLL